MVNQAYHALQRLVRYLITEMHKFRRIAGYDCLETYSFAPLRQRGILDRRVDRIYRRKEAIRRRAEWYAGDAGDPEYWQVRFADFGSTMAEMVHRPAKLKHRRMTIQPRSVGPNSHGTLEGMIHFNV